MARLKVCKIMTSIKKADQELFLSLFCGTRAFLKLLGDRSLTKKRHFSHAEIISMWNALAQDTSEANMLQDLKRE